MYQRYILKWINTFHNQHIDWFITGYQGMNANVVTVESD